MLRQRWTSVCLVVCLLLIVSSCGAPETTQPKPTNTAVPGQPKPAQSKPTNTMVPGQPKPANPTSTHTVQPFGDEVTFRIDDDYHGLRIKHGGDVDTETVEVAGMTGLRSGNGTVLNAPDGNDTADYYIQFQVDDAFLYAGSPTSRVVFEITYLDEGTDTFNIQYDALSGGVDGSGRFKDSQTVYKTGSGEIKTVEIRVCDANFANRDQDADFRIADSSDGAETILAVTVRRPVNASGPIEINVDSCGANPFDDQPDSDAILACIEQTCGGDTVYFTSGINDPDYQGYLIDKSVFLVGSQSKSDLTFRSTDASNHALLQATADLRGFVVYLTPREYNFSPGLIDNVSIEHLDFDGNRDERICTGDPLPEQEYAMSEGVNDNWGLWVPTCTPDAPDDSFCKPGTLYLNGGIDVSDPEQDYMANPDLWSTDFSVHDVTLSNTECGTAFFFEGAAFQIDSVTVDTAGEHTHAPGCQLTDSDDPVGAWSDGITFTGPAHELTNNVVMDASDIGIVSFGGRDIVIANNTIQARPGNHGMFAGIAMAPNTLGLIAGLEVTGNTVINEADPECGGIHLGINLGVHTWANGCMGSPSPATYGVAEDCSIFSPAPEGALCNTDTYCRTWGHVPAGETLTLQNNTVTGAQVSYMISGLDVLGDMVLIGNESVDPQLVDWEGDQYCVWTEGYAESWGVIDFAAFNPAIDGWVEQQIYCVR